MKKEYLIRIQVIWIQIIIYFILFKKKLFRVDAKVFLSTMFVSSIIFELSYWINLKNYYINILFFLSLKTFKSIILLIQITIRDDILLCFKCCSNYYEEDINNTRG